MSILILAAVAATSTPVHRVALEDEGTHYTIEYVAHLATHSRLTGIGSPRNAPVHRCTTTARVSVERRITDTTSGNTMSAMLPETTSMTDSQAGRCTAAAMRGDNLKDIHADTIAAHLAQTALTDKQHALATIKAARSLAAR